MKKSIIIVSMTIIAALLSSCDYGVGGGDDTVRYTGAFYSDPAAADIKLVDGGATGEYVTVDVDYTGAQPFFGSAFKITYDPLVAQFAGAWPGSLLEQNGSPLYGAATVNNIQGSIVVGATLKKGDVMVSGPGTIIKLVFRVKGAGSTTLAFSDNVLRDDAFAELTGLTWTAGYIAGVVAP